MENWGENPENPEESLECFVQKAFDNGAEFFVDGEEVLPHEILCRAVREDDYMADYIPDKAGGIAQVRLDKVKKQ